MMSLHVRITGQSQYHGFRGFTMVLSKAVSHSVAGSEMFHLMASSICFVSAV